MNLNCNADFGGDGPGPQGPTPCPPGYINQQDGTCLAPCPPNMQMQPDGTCLAH